MTTSAWPLPVRPSSSELSWRVLALLNLFRLLVPIVLGGLMLLREQSLVGDRFPVLFLAVLAGYFLFAVFAIGGIKRRWPAFEAQTFVHVCVDVIAISLLTYASGGVDSGLATLLILPVGATALTVAPRAGLLVAALATIGILLQQTLTIWQRHGDPADFMGAGVVGALFFVVTLAAEPLMRRLRESEALVKQRDVDLADLAQLNSFIIQHLRESILVVDDDDRIRLINESAAQLLKGAAVESGTLLGEISPRLLYLLDTWRRHSYDWQASTLSLVSADGSTVLQPHFVELEQSNRGASLIFLEDTSVIAERVQQSKLAALGRLSGSIAHEIRNPVGAMSHAAQLLQESPAIGTEEEQLTRIIRSNGERVSTIIENVMQLSRRDTTRQERIRLGEWLQGFLNEFRETLQIDGSNIRFAAGHEDVEVRVDPSHLHQLLWNLCENALRYGLSEGADPVEVRTGRVSATGRPFLEVADRGPGIVDGNRERIFEPFFTSGTGGTGLGLFIARELAQCNRAVLIYEPRQGGGSIFRVVFADPQRWTI
jgi:two-component system, NtrC family, sensor histidine kinase PilS